MTMRHTLILCLMAALLLTACDDTRSYSEMLNDETRYVNAFLADNRVETDIPADSIFEAGQEAPFYRLDPECNVYMQVLDPGNADVRPTKGDRVYFRFTRYNLSRYESGEELQGAGNAGDLGLGATFFIYADFTAQQSVTFGEGVQSPMIYLGEGAHVRLVVKSQVGWSSEIASVTPWLYDIRYYSSPMSPWASEIPE